MFLFNSILLESLWWEGGHHILIDEKGVASFSFGPEHPRCGKPAPGDGQRPGQRSSQIRPHQKISRGPRIKIGPLPRHCCSGPVPRWWWPFYLSQDTVNDRFSAAWFGVVEDLQMYRNDLLMRVHWRLWSFFIKKKKIIKISFQKLSSKSNPQKLMFFLFGVSSILDYFNTWWQYLILPCMIWRLRSTLSPSTRI